MARLNPHLSEGAVAEVISRVADDALLGDPISKNRRVHGLITAGVPITYVVASRERHDQARLVGWADEHNAWHAYNQIDVAGRVALVPGVFMHLSG